MSGINRNDIAQSNVEFTGFIHPVVKVPESPRCCKVKFMVDYISMKVCYHKSIPLIMSGNRKLYNYVTLGFVSATVEKPRIIRSFVRFNYGRM
jgi:hypothetical protein